jgi:hypothetical protein
MDMAKALDLYNQKKTWAEIAKGIDYPGTPDELRVKVHRYRIQNGHRVHPQYRIDWDKVDVDAVCDMRFLDGMAWKDIAKKIEFPGSVSTLMNKVGALRGGISYDGHDYQPRQSINVDFPGLCDENIPESKIPWSDKRPFTRREMTDMIMSIQTQSGCSSSAGW